MIRLPVVAVLALALAACQSPAGSPRPLARNVLACREASTAAGIARAGAAFQRATDDALASGACRLFPSGTSVIGAGGGRFAEARTGQSFVVVQ